MSLPDATGISEDEHTEELLRLITRNEYASLQPGWKYESRREAQLVTSFLYLGPLNAAKDAKALTETGITMLLVIRDLRTALGGMLNGAKMAQQLGIEAESVDVDGGQGLIAALPRAIRIINDHLIRVYHARFGGYAVLPEDYQQRCGKILVFCETGNDRSAAVVAAYLMTMYGHTVVEAIQYIQNCRFCISFDDGLKDLLFNYQLILQAKRDVTKDRGSFVHVQGDDAMQGVEVHGPKKKRRERDEEMNDDDERFAGRSHAPFTSYDREFTPGTEYGH